MSNIKQLPTRVLKVIPTDDCNIPLPNLLASGTVTDDTSGTILVDLSVQFIVTNDQGNVEYKVNVGDVVYFYDTNVGVYITEVIDENTLSLSSAGGIIIGDSYEIYQQSPITGLQNQGCALYIDLPLDTTVSLSVVTAGEDSVDLSDASAGTLPFQIVKVNSSGTSAVSKYYALW
jgi:hypothetical protein